MKKVLYIKNKAKIKKATLILLNIFNIEYYDINNNYNYNYNYNNNNIIIITTI